MDDMKTSTFGVSQILDFSLITVELILWTLKKKMCEAKF